MQANYNHRAIVMSGARDYLDSAKEVISRKAGFSGEGILPL